MTLIAIGLLTPVALAIRVLARSWLHPGAIFAGFWYLAAVLPLWLFDASRTSIRTLFYIVIAIVVFGLGTFSSGANLTGWPVMPGRCASHSSLVERRLRVDEGILDKVVKAGAAAGLAAAAISVWSYGFSVRSLFSLNGLLAAGNGVAVARYGENAQTPVGVPWLLSLAFCAALVAPFAYVNNTGRRRLWMLGPGVSTLCYSLVTTARFAFLLSVAMTASSILALQMLRKCRPPKISTRGLLVMMLTATLVGGAFVGIAFVKIGTVDPGSAPVIERKMAAYAFAYENALSNWLGTQPVSDHLSWGTATFGPVGFLLGGANREDQRRYSDFSVVNSNGQATNIYTMFRGLLEDFGTTGAVAVLFGFGMVMGSSFRLVTERGSVTAAAIFACCCSTVLLSQTQAITTFTNVCLAMALAILLVRRAVHCLT